MAADVLQKSPVNHTWPTPKPTIPKPWFGLAQKSIDKPFRISSNIVFFLPGKGGPLPEPYPGHPSGLSWPWPLLACPGFSWPPLASPGLFWHLLARHHPWLQSRTHFRLESFGLTKPMTSSQNSVPFAWVLCLNWKMQRSK